MCLFVTTGRALLKYFVEFRISPHVHYSFVSFTIFVIIGAERNQQKRFLSDDLNNQQLKLLPYHTKHFVFYFSPQIFLRKFTKIIYFKYEYM